MRFRTGQLATWTPYGSACRTRCPRAHSRHHRPRDAGGAPRRRQHRAVHRVRPDRRFAARRASRRATVHAPVPTRRPSALSARGWRDRHGRRPRRSQRGAQPPRQRDPSAQRRTHQGAADQAARLRARAVPGHVGQQRRLDASHHDARVPPRRRQALHGQPDDGEGLGSLAHRERARHLVHRVQLHAAAGQRLPASVRAPRRRTAGRRVRSVGQHRRRRRIDPSPPLRPGVCDHASVDDQERRRQVRQVGRGIGVARSRRAPRRTSSASSGCSATTTWSART